METCDIGRSGITGTAFRREFLQTRSSKGLLVIIPSYSTITHIISPPFSNPEEKALIDKVNVEYEKNSDYLKDANMDDVTFKEISDKLVKAVAKIKHEKIAVELTPLSTLKFKLILSAKRKLIITKHLLNCDLKSEDVFFSLFFDKSLLVSDNKNIYSLVKGLNDFSNKVA